MNSMSSIADFTKTELDQIKEILTHQYGKDIEIQLTNCEILLMPQDQKTTRCRTVFWYQGGANFMISKIDSLHFKAQYFYTPHDQFGTDTEKYTDLNECVVRVLKTQSEHDREEFGDASQSNG